MNTVLDWNLWRPFFTTLAVGTVLVVAIAMLLQRWTRSMAWRRTIWQVAFLGLGLLAITEISGAGRAAWSWLPRRSQPKPDGQLLMESKVIGEPDLRMLLAQRLQAGNVQAVQSVPDNSPAEEPVRWPGAIWLMGFAAAISWMVLARLVFVIFVPRRRVTDECLLARVNSIAHRLGELRRVRVGETRGLAGPIAFGILRPGISLPEGFTTRFTNEQQDAMLAHELAHLAARDPLWHALADLVTAMLWWHPLAWLAKQQLRAASEAAADEASLVVENGPNVLAECLVELGARLTRTHSLGWLGMAGGDFRSSLGRRVKRLVSLGAQSWKPMRRSRVWMVRIAVPLALVALAFVATVWAQPPLGGPSTLRQAFQRSVLGLALAAALPQAPTPLPETDGIDWHPWSHEALVAARAEGKTVLVYFTADWALSAKINEQTSLGAPVVRAKLRELGAVTLRGDYTQDDEAIARELLAFGRSVFPLTLVYPSDPSLSPQVLPELLTPQIVLDALEQGNAASKTSVSKAATDPAVSDKNRAPALILQGRSLQQAGKQAEAKAKFEEALKLDPGNLAARHYLSLLQEPPGSNPYPRTNLVRSSPGHETIMQESDLDDIIKHRIREQFGDRTNLIKHLQAEQISYETYRQREWNRIKLDSVRLEEVSFPGLPLNEVVEKLATMIKAADPEGKGINFIIHHGNDDSGRIDPSTGLPESYPFFATKVVVRLTPLRDVTARQAIDAIVRVAETPLRYSVEDYAVVFTPSPPAALHTRWFRIAPNTFIWPMSESATTNMDQAIKEASSAPPVLVDSPLPGKVYRTSVTPTGQHENAEARRFFTKAGVDFTVPGKSLVFNERLNQLAVRATLQDLDIIEQALQVVNKPPPQVTIEVKFCEVPTEDTRALGFDWFLGHATTNNVRSQDPGWPLVGEFLNVLRSFSSPKTNSLTTSFLTDAQYRVVTRALEQRKGVNILTPPKVTTLSGRQAQVKTVSVRYVVTDLDLSQTGTNGTAQAQPIAEPFELGPILDVVPHVQADGQTIQMTVIPTLTEFIGYDMDYSPRRETITTADGRKEYVTVLPDPTKPRPIFRKRQIVTNVTAFDGQTVVLVGGSDLLLANPNKNQPLREGTKPPQEPKQTKLLIFVTATLIDPAGNRLHPTEETSPGIPKQGSPTPDR
jgi:beta-lactamase regulating signal transducer with metallopeptidase domain